MKNKFLITALLGLAIMLAFPTTSEAHPHNRGKHKHIMYRFGRPIITWHWNNRACNFRNCNYNNSYRSYRNSCCVHMRQMLQGCNGRNQQVRCNHRGCNMYGRTYNGNYGNGRDRDNYRYDDDHDHDHDGNNGYGNNGYGNGRGRGNGGRR